MVIIFFIYYKAFTLKRSDMDCGCGRSPNGKCLGWHDLSEEEYLEKLKEYEKNQKAEG